MTSPAGAAAHARRPSPERGATPGTRPRPAPVRLRRGTALAGALLALGAGAVEARAQGVTEGPVLSAGRQRELTLREAVEIGAEENPAVRSALFRRGAAGAGILEAYGNFLPRLALFGGVQRSSRGQVVVGGVPIPSPATYATFYTFDFTHRLFDAGRDFLRLGTARAEQRAADAQIEDDRLRVAAEIKRQYVAALAAGARRAQAERQIESRRVRLDLVNARFELGEVTRSDELQARIDVSQAEVDRVTAERDVRAAELELLRTMGVEADPDSIELVDRFEIFEPELDPDVLVAEALRDHPRLERLRAEREALEDELWIARTGYLPTLNAGFSYEGSVSDTSDFLFRDFDDRTTVSVTLSWDLFNGFSRERATSVARAELRVADEAVRDAELEIESSVRQAWLDLLNAWRTNLTQGENVELAQQQLELAQERYRIGALSFPDLQDAQVTFSAAETAYIRSTYDFFLALANLEEASAQPLFPAASAAAPLEPAGAS